MGEDEAQGTQGWQRTPGLEAGPKAHIHGDVGFQSGTH